MMRMISNLTMVGMWMFFVLLCVPLPASARALQYGMLYECTGGQSFKVYSCSGTSPTDLCDVQSYSYGQPNQRGKSPYGQVEVLVDLCQATTNSSPQFGEQSNINSGSLAGAGGFKVGDTVKIVTAGGWMDAKVLKVNGNAYYVRAANGADVWKTYPNELHRIGPINAEDRANGLYQLDDKVRVNIEGNWQEGEVITELGQQYQVQLPDGGTVWATAQNLQWIPPSPAPVIKHGVPPRPGLKSCAGRIEGRYSSSAGFGGMTIIFRSGKATLADLSGTGGDVVECWMSKDTIYLHKPGDPPDQDMPIAINNDGTLDTPLGEIRKKGN
jgi:hypothetical protein